MENSVVEDYIILESREVIGLRIKVLEKLKEGYVLLGGSSNGGDYAGHTQTMVKYKK
jgi:hypothetical protein